MYCLLARIVTKSINPLILFSRVVMDWMVKLVLLVKLDPKGKEVNKGQKGMLGVMEVRFVL